MNPISARSRKTLIVGFYGMHNFGDDLFVDVIENAEEFHRLGRRKVFLCPPVPGVNAKYSFLARRFGTQFGETSLRGRIARLLSALVGIATSRTVVLGGGSVLSQLTGVRRTQAILGRLFRTRWMAVGVSIGPFTTSTDRVKIRNFLQRFNVIEVRDERSWRLARDLEIESRRTLDLAYFKHPTEAPPARRLIYVPCSGVSEQDERKVIRAIDQGLSSLGIRSGSSELVIAVLNGHPQNGDEERARQAAHLLRHHSPAIFRYEDAGVQRTWDLLGSSKALVSGRLHGGIAAHVNGVPFVAIEYHSKVSDFLDDIGQDDLLRLSKNDRAVEDLIHSAFG